MNCDDARGLQIDRLLDSVDAPDRARLEDHERSCAACRLASEQMSELWLDLGKMKSPPPDSRALVRFGRLMGRSAPMPTRVRALIAASMVAMLSAGAVLGRATSPTPGPEPHAGATSHFLLALRGVDPAGGVSRDERVREYTAWAEDLYDRGQLVTAAELAADAGTWLGLAEPVDGAGIPLNGFFVVVADDYDDAVAIARSSPHLSYGGAIEIRRIVESP